MELIKENILKEKVTTVTENFQNIYKINDETGEKILEDEKLKEKLFTTVLSYVENNSTHHTKDGQPLPKFLLNDESFFTQYGQIFINKMKEGNFKISDFDFQGQPKNIYLSNIPVDELKKHFISNEYFMRQAIEINPLNSLYLSAPLLNNEELIKFAKEKILTFIQNDPNNKYIQGHIPSAFKSDQDFMSQIIKNKIIQGIKNSPNIINTLSEEDWNKPGVKDFIKSKAIQDIKKIYAKPGYQDPNLPYWNTVNKRLIDDTQFFTSLLELSSQCAHIIPEKAWNKELAQKYYDLLNNTVVESFVSKNFRMPQAFQSADKDIYGNFFDLKMQKIKKALDNKIKKFILDIRNTTTEQKFTEKFTENFKQALEKSKHHSPKDLKSHKIINTTVEKVTAALVKNHDFISGNNLNAGLDFVFSEHKGANFHTNKEDAGLFCKEGAWYDNLVVSGLVDYFPE